eukprot:CAMPEP_0197181480 /NCGR_PEP_ID=MMETSP1423-20130617/5752_1 /TAXON_ID=476441 /ORGANISM="Pseudo-nitzschia heimii, Strain UNC1101" /LENGTH=634 /DNA_ID=CAMNT_0042631735 /DNA_START=262 /DNA_END=2166 /DNA_ORIENTATION=+
MTYNLSFNARDEIDVIDANHREKPPRNSSKARSLVIHEDEHSVAKNIAALVAPSKTDTTSSTRTTKLEDRQNETEILSLVLDYSSDIDVPKSCDNETCSVSSSTSSVLSRYFEPTDFLPWEELYSKAEYAPHVGFAMVAGGFAFLHPFVFFAGVVTAVGALRAAGATYEYAICLQQKGNTKVLDGDGSNIDDLIIPCDCLPNALGFNRSNNNGTTLSPIHAESGDADSLPPLANSCSTCSTNASTIGELSNDAKTKVLLSNIPGSTVPAVIKPFPEIQQTREETFDPTRWVEENFSTLPIVALQNVEFRGLNANEFFNVFFADDAPFGFPAFHLLRRDKEVQYSSWKSGVTSKKPIPPSVASKEREVQYHAKTNSFLGPAYAPTKKIQQAYFVSKKMLIIEIRMTLHDIPFSKQFYLIERWMIDGSRSGDGGSRSNLKSAGLSRKKNKNRDIHDSDGKSSTKASSHCVYLTVSSRVHFTEECPFESAVRKESAKQVCEISKCWNAMAQAGLKRTEESRRKRLRQRMEEEERAQQISPTSDLQNQIEGIEIEYVDSNDLSDQGRTRRLRSRSSWKNKIQRRSQSLRRPQDRKKPSKAFSKLLLRGKRPTQVGEKREKVFKSPVEVRISSPEFSTF